MKCVVVSEHDARDVDTVKEAKELARRWHGQLVNDGEYSTRVEVWKSSDWYADDDDFCCSYPVFTIGE